MTDQELSRLAATAVMGFVLSDPDPMKCPPLWVAVDCSTRELDWSPPTDWRAAGEIVDKMIDLGFQLTIVAITDVQGRRVYNVSVETEAGDIDATSDVGPLAITIGALLAVEAITEEQL